VAAEHRREANHIDERTMRTRHRLELFDAIMQDVRFGARQLLRNPGFTAIAVLTLALGIGANTAIFSVIYSVILRPLPYANADRVLKLNQRNGANPMCCLPFGNYDRWHSGSTNVFEALGAVMYTAATLTGRGDATRLPAISASADYWRAMYIPPAAGRYFSDAEDREGGPKVVVLSYALWQNRFGGDPAVIGQNITLGAQPYTVVGVAAPEYVLAPPMERIWLPLAPPAWRLNDFADHELSVYGLLKPGVSEEQALRVLAQIDGPLAAQHPHSGYDGGVQASSIVDSVVGPHRARLYMLLGAVVLVLLIACGNIANLLLARATIRRGEMAIRGALGASRGRITMQLLVESVLLSLAGAALGLGIAVAGMRFLLSSPVQIPRLHETTLNGPVLAFTLALAVTCAVVFGLVPALRASRLDLQQTLREGGRESRGAARERLRRTLVITELCVAQVLLIGAGLLIRSALFVEGLPPGFDTRNLLAMQISLPDARYATHERQDAALQQIEDALAAIPGVQSAGRALVAPIYGFGWDWTAAREGSNGHDEGAVDANMRNASPNYFATLGVHMLRGRAFSRQDTPDSPPVAIVSRGLAKRLYGDADPLGHRISNSASSKTPVWREIVGVVDDMRARGLTEEIPYELYIPSTQWVNPSQTYVIRGAVPVTTLVPAIRRAVASVDPLLALGDVSTMEQALSKQFAMSRFTTWLLALLGATGLVLAAVGVYGVISYFVTQRRHEFGVRMALGASPTTVRWMVVRQAMIVATIGVVAGAILAAFAVRVLGTMLYGVGAHDPLTFAGVAALLLVVGVLASYVPARRATRIDPLEALRSA
jgi:putative ABC transport system permease protein